MSDASRQCTATSKQTGEQCKRIPARGFTVCKWHGGSAPQVKRKAAERVVMEDAHEALTRLGVVVEVEPAQAILEELHRSAGNVRYLTSVVEQMREAEIAGLLVTETQDGDEKSGSYVRSSPSVDVWVRLWNEERDRKAKLAKLAIDAGIMERQVRIVEAMGAHLVTVVEGVVRELGLDPQEPQVRDVMRKAFTSATTTAIEVEAK